MSDLAEFLAASNLLPHGHCLFWRPDLLLLHVISDALIALAYFTIPLALLELIRRRKDLVFNHVFLLFACFITACGLTHVFNLADIWLALYPYSGIMKAITAVISLATAITVWRLLPDAVSLPSHQQLQERNIEIARINGQLREEIQIRKQAEQKLSEYANTLNTTNEELKDFVYIASHDLQEPLRLITSYLNVIKEDYGDKFDDDGQRFIDYTLDSSGRLQQLVTDLLGYSRLTTDQKPMAEYDSREIVQTALDDLAVAIEEAGANIHLTNTWPRLICDDVQLRLVFLNIIGNALKYAKTDNPAKITVSAVQDEDQTIFKIEDNGIGFEARQHDRIFQVFRRLHARHQYSGTGIGLAICKKIVERHGGKVWAESQPDVGSRFFFSIPASPDNQIPEAMQPTGLDIDYGQP